ncbi:phage capsid [uncultured virus]|uniref:Phage capsid n=1 Tax=uncultured virus TaxID=340016 RepID=A0A5Q0TWY0_9VIRU|nr:phage capsid [uncultured virus]
MAIFWQPTIKPFTEMGFTDDEFFSYTTEVGTYKLSRASISKEIMKRAMPELTFRKFVSKWTDFRAGTDMYFEMWKKTTAPYSQYWQTVGEFDPLPTVFPAYKRYSVKVEERGAQIPWTERAQIFSAIDIESEIRKHLEEVVVGSIERDLIKNAFMYLDVLGLYTTSGLEVHIGVSINSTKTFAEESGFPITINQYTIPAGTSFAPLTLSAIREFVMVLARNNCPSYDGRGFGRYVIIMNAQAKNRIYADPEFQTIFSRLQDARVFKEGYIGSYYGQELVEDNGRWIEFVFSEVNPSLIDKSICIFIGRDAIREAIVKPEEFISQKGDFNRFRAIGVNTYRGEQPTWFAIEGQAVGGILIAD